MTDTLLTVDEARTQIRCGRTKLYGLIDKGKIRIVKVGGSTLIRQSELERYVRAHERVA